MKYERNIISRMLLEKAKFLFLASFLVFTGCGSVSNKEKIMAVPTPEVTVAKPIHRTVVRTLELPGDVEAYQQALIYAKVSGFLHEVLVDKGDSVRAGQLLATLDSPELEKEELEAQSNLAKAKADRLANEAELKEAHETYSRLKRVYDRDPGLLARQDLDMSWTKVQIDEAKQEALSSEVRAAEAAFSHAADWVGYTQIRAPFSGIITQRYFDKGALIQSSAASAQSSIKPIFVIANSSEVRIYLHVPEPDARYVHPKTAAHIIPDAFPEGSISTQVTRVTGALDPGTRTMMAEIDLPNDKHRLDPGMFVKATLDLEAHKNALAVSTRAVLFEKDQRFVFLADNGKAKRQKVKTGFETPVWIEIVEGLAGNEEVIVAGKDNVSNGAPVEIHP